MATKHIHIDYVEPQTLLGKLFGGSPKSERLYEFIVKPQAEISYGRSYRGPGAKVLFYGSHDSSHEDDQVNSLAMKLTEFLAGQNDFPIKVVLHSNNDDLMAKLRFDMAVLRECDTLKQRGASDTLELLPQGTPA